MSGGGRPILPQDDFEARLAARRAAVQGQPSAPPTPTPGYGGESFRSAIGVQPAAKPERFRDLVHDAALGVYQGMSGGFGDELGAGMMALALGKPSAYKTLQKQAEGEVKASEARSPVLSLGGNVAGAMTAGALTGGVANAAGLEAAPAVLSPTGLARAGRALKNIGAAGTAGAVVGAGTASGGPAERLRGAETGLLSGAGAAVGLGAAGAVLRPFVNIAKSIIPRPATEANPFARFAASAETNAGTSILPTSAERMAGSHLLQDVERSGLSLDEYLARARANPTAALYDLGPSLPQTPGSPLIRRDPSGDPFVRRARGIQSIPSRGSSQLTDFTNARAEARPAAIQGALESGIGATRENTAQVAEQLIKQRAQESAPLYEKAFAHGAIDDPRINALIKKPIAAEAWRQANRLAAAEGRELPQVFTIQRSPTNILGRDGKPLMKESLVATDVPDVRTLHYLKLGLDDVIESNVGRPLDQGGISSSMAHAAQQQKNELLSVLDQVPAYKEARQTYAGNSDAMRAYAQGAKILSAKGDDLEHAWSQFSEVDKDLYRRSALAAIEDELSRTNNPGRLLNPLMARKLKTIFPDEQSYNDFEMFVRRKVQGARNDAMITGNSATQRIAAEQADLAGADEAIRSLPQLTSAKGIVGRILSSPIARAAKGETERRADALAPFLSATGTDAVQRLQYLQALQREFSNAARIRGVQRAGAIGTVAGRVSNP